MFPVVAICLVVSSNIASAMSSSLTVARSFVVLIGDRVDMKCNGSEWTKWTHTGWNTSTETDIYIGGQIVVSMRSRYTVDKNTSEQHNLIIDSVDLAHAGRYRCIAIIQETLWNDIQLTVLDSDPVCAANTTEAHVDGREQMHLIIWCSFSYTGNEFSVFNWIKSNAEKNIAADEATSGRGPFTKSSLIMQQLHADDNGVTFQCLITFQMPNNFKEVNHNVYVYAWNYTLYGPRNLSIVEREDRLECSADGNPTPTYRWTDVETHRSTNGSVYLLNRNSVNEHTVECTATNIFAAESKNYTIKGVSVFPITPLAIAGPLLFLPIIGLTIIVSCAVQRKRLRDNSAFSSERSPNYIQEEDRSPGKSESRTIADNPVYAEVMKPKGPSKGSKGDNIGDNSRPPPQTPNRERKIVIGVDGTECAEMSEVKPTARKGEVPQTPCFSQVEIYASIL